MPRLWPTGGLWRHPDFLKQWSAETISQVGSQVGQLALPLVAVIVLESTAFEVAALTTILFLPFILFTLTAGVWVDRMRRRPILIALRSPGRRDQLPRLGPVSPVYPQDRAAARARGRRAAPVDVPRSA